MWQFYLQWLCQHKRFPQHILERLLDGHMKVGEWKANQGQPKEEPLKMRLIMYNIRA